MKYFTKIKVEDFVPCTLCKYQTPFEIQIKIFSTFYVLRSLTNNTVKRFQLCKKNVLYQKN